MKRILTVLAAASTLAVATVAMPTDADARWRGHGGGAVAAGVIGGLAAGAIIGGAFANPYYGGGYYGGGYPGYGYGPAYGYGPGYGYAPAYAYEPVYAAPACGWRRQQICDANGFCRVRRVQVC